MHEIDVRAGIEASHAAADVQWERPLGRRVSSRVNTPFEKPFEASADERPHDCEIGWFAGGRRLLCLPLSKGSGYIPYFSQCLLEEPVRYLDVVRAIHNAELPQRVTEWHCTSPIVAASSAETGRQAYSSSALSSTASLDKVALTRDV